MQAPRIRSLLTVGAVTGGLLLAVGMSVAQDESFVIVDDEASIEDLIPLLSNGQGVAAVEKDDVYMDDRDRKAALRIDAVAGDFQKYNPTIPGWQFDIVANPSDEDEFRYITFAWKKEGGSGMQLQLSGEPGGWSHRYHASANMQDWNPSIQVTADFPADWQIHTRDMFVDWGPFVLTGMAFSPSSEDFGIYDHVLLHQDEDDPDAAYAVGVRGKVAAAWAAMKRDIR
ncbi:hypothetical protein HN371_21865 [Candidatus Poribacteria bacterium]|jgi:hypothetical protein|nr:hypothetical protein [Candidatus Poribacteria bacterium]MBT5536772.1 hypothetical protein [Candidatus Poribacteria bacterium]MBT7098484.1 hypothetical protein [Candidatus Poribacteria bacterium]MBT7807051.1 hypothetical protein [Candidatus Poribacteria bacterium]